MASDVEDLQKVKNKAADDSAELITANAEQGDNLLDKEPDMEVTGEQKTDLRKVHIKREVSVFLMRRIRFSEKVCEF